MARCGDCIHYEACLRFANVRIVLCGDKADQWCKVFKPTADVAPRAELAREIFEEIDSIRDKTAHGDIMRLAFFRKLEELKNKYTEANHETRN